ncbi:MAG: TetR family transcriptional regulator [Coriobacteriales bacterium]
MGKVDTKLGLAQALVELAGEKPYEKISVSDVITAAGKNRKTFYYHFEDKSHLTAWLFRYELAQLLMAEFSPVELVYQEPTDDPCTELPYYVFVKKGVRSLDGERFVKQLARVFESRRSFWAQVMREQGPNCLDSYLYQLYFPAIRRDILFVLSSRRLSAENVDFLAEVYTDALLSFFRRRLCTGRSSSLLGGVGPFANILHSSIEHEIREQQLRRML